MTIRCFLALSQWDAYLRIYQKLYYKWTLKHIIDGKFNPWLEDYDYIIPNFVIGFKRLYYLPYQSKAHLLNLIRIDTVSIGVVWYYDNNFRISEIILITFVFGQRNLT